MNNLVSLEQRGFLPSCIDFDNVITVQEVTHSLEIDTDKPPRMLAKIDTEKAFDTIEWSTILVILKRF